MKRSEMTSGQRKAQDTTTLERAFRRGHRQSDVREDAALEYGRTHAAVRAALAGKQTSKNSDAEMLRAIKAVANRVRLGK